MDWIEQLFGISPDNGDGSLEMAIAIAVVIAIAAVFAVRSGALRRLLRDRFGDSDSNPRR